MFVLTSLPFFLPWDDEEREGREREREREREVSDILGERADLMKKSFSPLLSHFLSPSFHSVPRLERPDAGRQSRRKKKNGIKFDGTGSVSRDIKRTFH